MKTFNYTEARKNFASVLDAVTDDQEPAVVTRAGHEPVVIVPLREYQSLSETDYLLRNPANAEHLRAGIAELEAGNTVAHEPIDEAAA